MKSTSARIRYGLGHRLSLSQTFCKSFVHRFVRSDHGCPRAGSNVISTDEERSEPLCGYGVSCTDMEPANLLEQELRSGCEPEKRVVRPVGGFYNGIHAPSWKKPSRRPNRACSKNPSPAPPPAALPVSGDF